MSKIKFFYEDTDDQQFNNKYIRGHIKRIINNESYKKGSLNIIFCSDEYLLRLNKEYLNHDYYTDIITFDYVENNIVSGDLYISIDRINENSQKLNINFKNELTRVIFHGILHLVGYNDKTESEKQEMRRMENMYLEGVEMGEIYI